MAPRNVSTWRRPYTSIYNDNYRYGSSLYSGTLSDIQKRHTSTDSTASKSPLRSEKVEISPSTLTNTGDPNPPASTSQHESPVRDAVPSSYRGSVFESMLNSALHSSYANDIVEERATTTTANERRPASRSTIAEPPLRPTSLYDDAGLFTLPKVTEATGIDLEETETLRRKNKRQETILTPPVTSAASDSQSAIFWKDKCLDLQNQLDVLSQAMVDMGTNLKGELSSLKGKFNNEVSDLHASLDDSNTRCNELQKVVKKQTNQLMELQISYEDLQRHLQDSLDEVSGWQKRNQTLRKEMDRLRSEVEETAHRGQLTSSN